MPVTHTGNGSSPTRFAKPRLASGHDVGGGSTEPIVGEGLSARRLESLYIGCVSLSARCFPDSEITDERMRKARTAAQLERGFPRGWLAGHPLTAADLEQEAEWLGSAGSGDA